MHTPLITLDCHDKFNKLKGLVGKTITVVIIEDGRKDIETGKFLGLDARGIKMMNLDDCSEVSIPFIGYEGAIVAIEDSEGNQIYNNATEDVIDFYTQNLPTFFEGSDGEGIVENNNKRVNSILTETFGGLYPELKMTR